jgi:hypothetical protein
MAAKWIKIKRGQYRLSGTMFGVASGPKSATDGDGDFIKGVEWAVIRFQNEQDASEFGGENLDWFDTMREARADAERRQRNYVEIITKIGT